MNIRNDQSIIDRFKQDTTLSCNGAMITQLNCQCEPIGLCCSYLFGCQNSTYILDLTDDIKVYDVQRAHIKYVGLVLMILGACLFVVFVTLAICCWKTCAK